VIQIPAHLQIHPEIGSLAEQPPEAKGRIRCDRAPPVDDLIEPTEGHAEPPGRSGLREAGIRQEILPQRLAGMGWRTIGGKANHTDLKGVGRRKKKQRHLTQW
jgi:hypothetical protein